MKKYISDLEPGDLVTVKDWWVSISVSKSRICLVTKQDSKNRLISVLQLNNLNRISNLDYIEAEVLWKMIPLEEAFEDLLDPKP